MWYLREWYFKLMEACTIMEAVSVRRTPKCEYDAYVRNKCNTHVYMYTRYLLMQICPPGAERGGAAALFRFAVCSDFGGAIEP